MTIYQSVLGDDFFKLHPKLQERYSFSEGKQFTATGTMAVIQQGAWYIRPFLYVTAKMKFLFPESGVSVPFQITNHSFIDEKGRSTIYWNRIFYFPKKTRYFDATMTKSNKGNYVHDELGNPSFVSSALHFHVTDSGELRIHSGIQHVNLGPWKFKLPSFLTGQVKVEEGYSIEQEVFTIRVTITNVMVGRILMYEGEFTASH